MVFTLESYFMVERYVISGMELRFPSEFRVSANQFGVQWYVGRFHTLSVFRDLF